MAKRISLIVGAHAHLSPCAGDDEFEELYKNKLKPFITALNQFPKIQAALHYSGSLLSRLEQKKPEFFMLIGDLVARRQVEILGGGFFEPPLPLLSATDRIGQIEMLTTYLRQKLGKKPQGCLLANHAWEQSLVGVLSSCGFSYTFLGEAQCSAAGVEEESLYSPVFTEDQGKLIMVFPVFAFSKTKNANLAAWARSGISPKGIIGELKNYLPQDRERSIVTIFPNFPNEDAENVIRLFCEELQQGLAEKNREFNFEISAPGKVYKSLGSLSRSYFPSSMCPDYSRESTHIRPLLIMCPESNDLYAKICFVHSQISQLKGDKSRKRAAQEELWKAQGALCQTENSIRQSDLRKYAYRSLISAEKIVREKGFIPSLLALDFNLNGTSEYLFQDKNLNCYVRTEGASLFELDYLPKSWNYLDTFACKTYRRCAFMDRLLPPDFIEKTGKDIRNADPGRFCGTEEYSASVVDRQKSKAVFKLPPKKNLPFGSVEIEKIYQLGKNVVTLSYTLSNGGDETLDFCFCPQTDFSLAGEGEDFYSVYRTGAERVPLAGGEWTAFQPQDTAEGEVPGSPPSLEVLDIKNGAVLNLSSEQPFRLFFYAIGAGGPISLNDKYQSTCFLPVFKISLKAGESWKNRFTLSISASKAPRSSNPR